MTGNTVGAGSRCHHHTVGFHEPVLLQGNAGFVVSVIPKDACLRKSTICRGQTMTLKQQLTEDMKTAMRSGDKARLGVIRLMLAAIKQHEVDERVEQTDAMVLATLEKMLKQRRDSIQQYSAAKREDLAAVERAEMTVIEAYLPAKLSDAEIDALITAAIASTGASSPRDMGKVVGAVKEKAAGRADMAVVSGKIKARLAG
jgi:uncharacterized protein YqeY